MHRIAALISLIDQPTTVSQVKLVEPRLRKNGKLEAVGEDVPQCLVQDSCCYAVMCVTFLLHEMEDVLIWMSCWLSCILGLRHENIKMAY